MNKILSTAAMISPFAAGRFTRSNIVFEAPDEGGSGGEAPAFDSAFSSPEHQRAHQEDVDFGMDEFEGESLAADEEDMSDLLGMFAEEEEDPANPKKPDDSLDVGAAARDAAALTEDLKKAVSGYKLPDDLFGEEFQSGDTNAIRAAIENSTRMAIGQAIGLAMKPMKMALGQLQGSVSAEMKKAISDSQNQYSNHTKLEQLVPALGNKASRGILEPIRKHLESQGKSVDEQGRALSQLVTRLKLSDKNDTKGAPSKRSNRGKAEGGEVLRGTAALDGLFR